MQGKFGFDAQVRTVRPSLQIGVLFPGVFVIRALLLGFYIRVPHFSELPCSHVRRPWPWLLWLLGDAGEEGAECRDLSCHRLFLYLRFQ